MAINNDKAKAVKAVEDYTMRYYGRIRTAVEPVSIVGSPGQCIEKIHYFLSKGLDTLIIGVADPDPRQLDLFGEKVLPQLK
jgi:alkanesulfonate monooxygenase SsuD/methylene tetrahydromethanopterin reductase-like flavin-dependent oxidoreductase (luciferase family)